MSREAMKLALEALEYGVDGQTSVEMDEAITALREALAEQPAQQEPVGRLESDPDEGHVFVPRIDGDWSMLGEDLYTSPPAQQEPVAWGVDWGQAGQIPCVSIIKRLPGGGIEVVAVEYAPYEYNPPAQRTWVGLTPEEKKNIFLKWYGKHWAYTKQVQAVMDSAEAKLKEKNT